MKAFFLPPTIKLLHVFSKWIERRQGNPEKAKGIKKWQNKPDGWGCLRMNVRRGEESGSPDSYLGRLLEMVVAKSLPSAG